MQLTNPNVEIKKADIAQVVAISHQIPEFDAPYGAGEYEKRLSGARHLILAAYGDGKPAGFKVGYERFGDNSFYSWMGGVLPTFRNRGVADALANEQERWALANGYRSIVLKTRNAHKAMLCFALGRGFSIVGFDDNYAHTDEYRILLRKWLLVPS